MGVRYCFKSFKVPIQDIKPIYLPSTPYDSAQVGAEQQYILSHFRMSIHRGWHEQQEFDCTAFDYDAGRPVIPSRPRNPLGKIHGLPSHQYAKFTVSRAETPIPPKCHIHTLPPEIICCIFRMCGDPNPFFGYPRDIVMHRGVIPGGYMNFYSKAAVMLGRVCSRWFTVSRGDPLLWTLVDLTFPTTPDLAITNLCLKYSAGLPLALQIYDPLPVHCDNEDEEDDEAVLIRLMGIVASNAHRWGELSLHLKSRHETLDPLLSIPQGSFTCLSRATIEMDRLSLSATGPVARLYRSFYKSPFLRSVNWWADPFASMTVDGAPLQHITHVGVHIRQEPQEIFMLLVSCPRLQALRARISLTYPEYYEGTLTHSPIDLPYLRTLILGGYHTWNWILDCLIVPRLDRLEIAAIDVPGLKAVETMLSRSSAQPRMLTFTNQLHGHLKDTIALLRSQLMAKLQIFRYVPFFAMSWDKIPDGESLDELASFLPSHIQVVTSAYYEAEDAYARLSCMSL